MHYVVIAEFEVLPPRVDEFARALQIHTSNTRRLEPGCLTFDACQDPAKPHRFLLYEVYRDESAYATHRAMASYAHFIGLATPMLVKKDRALFQERQVLRRIEVPESDLSASPLP